MEAMMAAPDHTQRMKELLERHAEDPEPWKWKKPSDPPEGHEHVVTGTGLPETGGRHYALGALCDWLEALDRAQMGPVRP